MNGEKSEEEVDFATNAGGFRSMGEITFSLYLCPCTKKRALYRYPSLFYDHNDFDAKMFALCVILLVEMKAKAFRARRPLLSSSTSSLILGEAYRGSGFKRTSVGSVGYTFDAFSSDCILSMSCFR